MGLEAAVVGGFAAMGWTGAAAAITASVVSTAIIGAAIGGLTSAVMGGDIGQGMLFGAIGGAVLGGITGVGAQMGSGVSTAVSGAETATNSLTTVNTAGEFGMAQGSVGTFNPETFMGIEAGKTVAPSMLENLGAQIGVSALEGGAKAYLMKGAAEDKAEGDAAQQTEYLNTLMEKQKLTGEQALQQIAAQKETASAAEKMATDSRMAELDQRKNEFAQTLGFQREQYAQTQENQANRQALFGGTTRRGGMVEDKPNDVGIYDTLQKKPVTALVA